MLIAAGQRVEHYEIAAYGTACSLAKALDLPDALRLLSNTLSEAQATDAKLSKASVPAMAAVASSEK
jgi:ferritin-like metal-binding protein YciE